jgi:hypothetical protein
MSEKTEAMKRSVERDEKRVQKLQESIRQRKEQIQKTENEEIIRELNSIASEGISTVKIVEAIKKKDAETLFRLVEKNNPAEKGGAEASPAFQNNKEAVNHE